MKFQKPPVGKVENDEITSYQVLFPNGINDSIMEYANNVRKIYNGKGGDITIFLKGKLQSKSIAENTLLKATEIYY